MRGHVHIFIESEVCLGEQSKDKLEAIVKNVLLHNFVCQLAKLILQLPFHHLLEHFLFIGAQMLYQSPP
jgi:hypothetical protein